MKYTAIAIVILSLAGVTAHAQGWGQCPAGQWCAPQQQQQPDAMDNYRRQQAEMQAAQARRMEELREQAARQAAAEQANRRMCTSYTTNPLTGQVTAVTAPCF